MKTPREGQGARERRENNDIAGNRGKEDQDNLIFLVAYFLEANL